MPLIHLLLASYLAALPHDDTMLDVHRAMPELPIHMPYATLDNVAGVKLYAYPRCLLRPPVVAMLRRAQAYLDEHAPGTRLMLKDCYRPKHAQRKLFAAVQGTPQQPYVANPFRRYGSVHTYGAAVDVTLSSRQGKELDMGTPFDHLGPLAEPRREAACLKADLLTLEQVTNRRLLREAMTRGGGFLPMSREWWHFDAWRGASLRARYEASDKSFDEFP